MMNLPCGAAPPTVLTWIISHQCSGWATSVPFWELVAEARGANNVHACGARERPFYFLPFRSHSPALGGACGLKRCVPRRFLPPLLPAVPTLLNFALLPSHPCCSRPARLTFPLARCAGVAGRRRLPRAAPRLGTSLWDPHPPPRPDAHTFPLLRRAAAWPAPGAFSA